MEQVDVAGVRIAFRRRGRGHECFLESPDAFAAAVRVFLFVQREAGPVARP